MKTLELEELGQAVLMTEEEEAPALSQGMEEEEVVIDQAMLTEEKDLTDRATLRKGR